eukprot:5900703-Pleurochrysis_carterae.AAC.1
MSINASPAACRCPTVLIRRTVARGSRQFRSSVRKSHSSTLVFDLTTSSMYPEPGGTYGANAETSPMSEPAGMVWSVSDE